MNANLRDFTSNLAVALCAVAACEYAQASTVTIADAVGFENLLIGNLDGQLAETDNGATTTAWAAAGTPTGTAEVQNAVAASGTLGVQVERAPNADDRWAVPVNVTPANPVVIQWDMYVVTTTTPTGAFAPLFGIEAYDSTGGISLLGSLFVDSGTGDVVVQEAGTGFLENTGTVVALDDWNSFELVLDYAAGTASGSVNGSLVDVELFIDGPASNFTDADIAAIGGGGDPVSQGLAGAAFFDNYVVFEIPEPSTGLLAVGGIAALFSRRKLAA